MSLSKVNLPHSAPTEHATHKASPSPKPAAAPESHAQAPDVIGAGGKAAAPTINPQAASALRETVAEAPPQASADAAETAAKQRANPQTAGKVKKDADGKPVAGTANATRKKELSPEHLNDPASLDATNVKEYNYNAIKQAHENARNELDECKRQITAQKIELASRKYQFENAPSPTEAAKLETKKNRIERSIEGHVEQQKVLEANVGHFNNALKLHSPMRTKYAGKLMKIGQNGIMHMNTLFMLLSIPSMYMMVKSFFPAKDSSKDTSDEGGPPPPQLTSTSGPQSFQPRGVINHQANLMRQYSAQQQQLSPALQSAFLQGPVSGFSPSAVPAYLQPAAQGQQSILGY